LRSDCEVGICRKKTIEKFVVWRIEVVFAGIDRDGAKSLYNLGWPRSHGQSVCRDTDIIRGDS